MTEPLWRELQELLHEREVVVLVGAGASIQISGNPEIGGFNVAGWEGLLRHGLQQCVDVNREAKHVDLYRQLLDSGDFLGVAEFVARALGGPGDGEFTRWLGASVGKLEPNNPAVAKALEALNVPLFTTNYDTLLERVTRRSPLTWKDGSQWQSVQEDPNAGIVHLHGIFNRPDTVVLGARSYESVVSDERAQNALRSLASTTSLVFVGFGAGIADPNFAGLRGFLSTVLAESPRHHYRLVVNGDVDNARKQHEPGEHIQVLGHGDSHDSLADRLFDLAPERPASPGVPRPSERPRPVLEIHITSKKVVAEVPGEPSADGKLELDVLRLETVMLLDEWLRFQEDQMDDERSKRSDVVKLLGTILFDAVINGDVRALYRRKLRTATRQAPLSIVLRVTPDILTRFDGINGVGLTQLPWELLCDVDGKAGYLSTSPVLTFSRVHAGERDTTGWEATSEPRVLVVLAQPEGLVRALREEWDEDRSPTYDELVGEIVETVRNLDRRPAEDADEERVRVVGADEPATYDQVEEALQDQLPQIVHYIGHGRALRDQRSVAFADPDSEEPDWRSFTAFAESIDVDQPPILVFLHLCQGPRSLQAEEGSLARGNFSTLAFELIQRQVRMVVAMQYPASADVGLKFTRKFYDYLIKGRTVAEAVQSARKDVRSTLPVGGPVLYLRGDDGAILRRPEGAVAAEAMEAVIEQSLPESQGITTTRPAPRGVGGGAPSRLQRVAAETGFGEASGQPSLLPDRVSDVPPRQKAATEEGSDTINVGRAEERQ